MQVGFVGLAFLIVFVLLLSPLINKWYVEKHRDEWTGAKIRMETLRLNPFRGSISVKGLKVFARKSDVIFSGRRVLCKR